MMKAVIITNGDWNALPLYGQMYMKPDFENRKGFEGLVTFCHKYLIEYAYTENEAKKECIEVVVFPLYKLITGIEYKKRNHG